MGTFLTDWLGPEMANSSLATGILLSLVLYILLLLVIALGLIGLTIHLRQGNERKAQKWLQLEQTWEPLLNKVLSGDMPVARLHQQMKPGEGLFFVDFLTRYSMRLAGTSRTVFEELAAPWLPMLAERLSTGDEEQRARAVFTLSTLAPEHYREQISSALNDKVPLVAMLAARSLAENHASEFLELLLMYMDRFKAWSPAYLTSLLVEIAKPAPARLRLALSSGAHPVWIQTLALRALSELNDLESLPRAVLLLETGSDPELQAAALDLLGRLGTTQHKALVREKSQAADFVIRLHAVKALNRLADTSDEALLSALLQDESQWIAYQAARALKAIEALDVLEQMAESEHPRAGLAQQVLYDLESEKQLLAVAQRPTFVKRVPAWVRMTLRRQSSAAWLRLQHLLLAPETHAEVKLAIASELSPEAHSLQPAILRQLASVQHEPAPAYLYRALYNINPQSAPETLKQHFFLIEDETARAEILQLMLKRRTPATESFVTELRQTLKNSRAFRVEFRDYIEAYLGHFSALPS